MEIHRADRAYRKRTLWLIALIVVLCTVLLWQLNLWLSGVTEHLGGSDPDTVRRWLRLMLVGLGLALAAPAVGLGLSLRRLGYAARLQGDSHPRNGKPCVTCGCCVIAAPSTGRVASNCLASVPWRLAGGLAGWALWAWWRYGG